MAILAVAITLVLVPQNDEPNKGNDIPPNTETYATAFSVNIPSTIKMPIGSKINFLEGFVTVSPSSVINKLEIEEFNGDEICFENNTLVANAIGNYSLKFKMPKSKTTYFSKTISIVVCDVIENDQISLIKNSIEITSSVRIDQMFLIADNLSYVLTTDDKISCENNILTANQIGESMIKFSVVENYLQFIYDFNVNVIEQPEYYIINKHNIIFFCVKNNCVVFNVV